MTDELPLPEPELLYYRPSLVGPGTVRVTGYTADQMRAYGDAAVDEYLRLTPTPPTPGG
jgi:hypothetical protein